MEIYKYLRGILFSGGGLVLNPACPSCHILATDRDEADCGCDEKQEAAASRENNEELFTLDLTQYDPFIY